MDQIVIGKFIAKKRKEKNFTQEQLAERLGVSNKTISKWETGKCLPDYSIVESLCRALDITMAELFDGEEDEKSIHTYDNQQVLKMLEETQMLKKKKKLLMGIVLLLAGVAFLILSQLFGGTEVLDALSGFSLGIAFPHMLLGVVLVIQAKIGNKKRWGIK